MSDAIWVAALLFLIWPGTIVWRLPLVARLDLAARTAIAFACGVAIAVVLLYAYNFAHIPWTRTTVGVPLLLIGVGGVVWRRASARVSVGLKPDSTLITTLVLIVLTLYGVATARETCADLIYFWGPKAVQFHNSGRIDPAFLGFPHYYLMHPDYPPLLPLAYEWPSLAAHAFSWWGALLLMPVALAAIAFAFRGLANDRGWHTMLLTAILAYGLALGMTAGAADPPLLMFEVIAVSALTFAGEERDGRILAAVAIAAAALTKVEGAAFAIVTLIAYLIVTRKLVRALAMAIPAIVLLGSWIAFSARHHLLDAYWNPRRALHLEVLGRTASATLREASYSVAYVPWIGALVPLAITRRLRPAALPLLVAAGTIASTLFFYLHSDDPSWWIKSSATRVLLTPLACLVIAAAASSVAPVDVRVEVLESGVDRQGDHFGARP